MAVKNPEVLIHVLGANHDSNGVEFFPSYKETALNFFFPKGRKGINLFILENYAFTSGWRDEFLAGQRIYSIHESMERGAFWKVKDQRSPEDISEKVRDRVREGVESLRYQRDYFTRRLIMLDELKKDVNFKVDSEYYSEAEVELNNSQGKEMLKRHKWGLAGLHFGEKDLSIKEFRESLAIEVAVTRRRHPALINLTKQYVEQARIAGLPVRVMINFGSGHVRSLVKGLEKAFTNLNARYSILSSYAEADDFLSHQYDLIGAMESDPQYIPNDREIINALLQVAFVVSSPCAEHPLRKRLFSAQLNNMLYPLLRDLSEKDVDNLLKTILVAGYEEGLTQLTGVGDHLEPPSLLCRMVTWPLRRVDKFMVLGM